MRTLRTLAALSLVIPAGAVPLAARAAQAQQAGSAPHEVVRRWRSTHEAQVLRELATLLAVPNVASDSVQIRRNAALLQQMLQRRGMATRLLESPTGGPPAVYGELPAPGATRTVVFYAHYDGQPVVDSQWVTPPWEPTLRDRALDAGGRPIPMPADGARVDPEARLYARSASDDKAPIVAMLTALDALRDGGVPPTVNLKLFLEGEEEAGSDNLRALLTAHRELLRADGWIFGDGPRHQSGAMQVVYGVRGVLPLNLTVYGPSRALHSGHYGNWAPNPASMLATLLASMRRDDGTVTIAGFADSVRAPSDAERRAIAAIADTDAELARALALGHTEVPGVRLLERILLPSLNVTGLQAGGVGAGTSNTIRTAATAAIDFRLVPAQTPEQVRRVVEAHLRAQGWHVVHDEPPPDTLRAHAKVARLTWGEGYRGIRTDLELPFAHAVAQLVDEAVDGPVLRVPSLGGSLPMAHFEDVLQSPLVIVPVVNADNNQHAPNENLRIGNLWDAMEIYGQLLARLGTVWR